MKLSFATLEFILLDQLQYFSIYELKVCDEKLVN